MSTGQINARSLEDAAEPGPTPVTDGRRRRSERSRDRIVQAMLDLVSEGAVSPSAESVALRAGVGLRSVFRHFRDMDSLFAEIATRLARQYDFWLVPFVASDWRGQIAETMDRRLTTYEMLLPFKRAADAHRHRSAAIRTEHDRARMLMRARLEAILPPDVATDRLRVEAIDMLMSFDVWQRLRTEQALDPAVARALVERQIATLIA